jgi:hypothetical protein
MPRISGPGLEPELSEDGGGRGAGPRRPGRESCIEGVTQGDTDPYFLQDEGCGALAGPRVTEGLERDAGDTSLLAVRMVQIHTRRFDVRARAPHFALGEGSGAEHYLRRGDDERRFPHRGPGKTYQLLHEGHTR